METKLLISEVKHLLELENTKKREKKARGERFNIFSIMRKKTDEVYTHSALIAAMLNPNGPHGSGNMYLNLFLQSVSELHGIDFDTANAKADYEYSIGDINEDKTEGGRIDILIESGKKAIIIENKIYAENQPKQLLRYENFAKSNYSEYYILYLTLDGKEASNESCKGMSEEYIKVSYRDTIKDWLTKCIEKSATKPLVRETLIQYQSLILKLTHQDMDESTIKSFSSLCKEADDLKAMLQIHEYYDSIMDNVLSNILPEQLRKLADGKHLTLKLRDKKWNEKRMSFSFARPNWKYFEIAFMFENKNFTDMRCGFRYIQYNEDKQYSPNTTYDELKKRKEGQTSSRWPYYYKCDSYANWKKGSVIESIYNGDLIKKIENDLKRLLTIADNLSEKRFSL